MQCNLSQVTTSIISSVKFRVKVKNVKLLISDRLLAGIRDLLIKLGHSSISEELELETVFMKVINYQQHNTKV